MFVHKIKNRLDNERNGEYKISLKKTLQIVVKGLSSQRNLEHWMN